MGDVYQHPVFFECPGLLGEQKEKRIEKYFRIHRKSGGGDCGPLERLTHQTYSVAFKDPKDQLAVLQRSEHVVDGLVFSVRGSREALTSSPSQDLTAPLQSPQCIPASTPSPSGEEYELRLESHCLRYLKECPKAVKELEEALTSVACSSRLYEGRALVSRLAQAGAGAAVRNWKSEVDKLFDGYMCHYEVDPHKIKILLQACSFRQTTDEVKVYNEVGMAVVVGERSQVNAMLMAVEDLHVKQRSGYSEKQRSNHRLGSAKLRLLWKDLERSLQQDFPGVKVTQGAAGQLVLEGSAGEILKAEDFISQQENAVLERTVSDMSLHLLAFLRKAYGGPGVLGDFLGVGGKVEIELQDTEVRFLSLSTDDLDETVKALQGKIKEVKIDVPNCSSVPSNLRELLKSKTNEMNQGQYRARVVLGPDSMMCLLGHTKEVEELREGVIQFLDESTVQSIVHLPFTVLAQELPELLQRHGFDYSGVNFHPKRSSSGSAVVLEGPSGKVAEVRNWLGLFLDSRLEDRVTTDQLGTVRYSQSPTGNDEFPNVASDLGSLSLSEACDRLLQGRSSGNAVPRDLGFQEGATGGAPEDGVHVEIIQGTIETQQVDALASPMVCQEPFSTGVGNTLYAMVGSQLTATFRKEAREGTVPGDAVLVEGLTTLPFAVFFLDLIPWDEDPDGTAVQVLKLAISNILTSCEHIGFRSVALPVLSTGIGLRFPNSVVARVLLEEVHAFEQNRAGRTPFLLRVVIPPNDEESSEAFRCVQEAFQIKRFTKDIHQPDQDQLAVLQRSEHVVDGLVFSVRGSREALTPSPSQDLTAPLQLLQGRSSGNAAPRDLGFQEGATGGAPEDGVHVEIIQGTIETQQVDALASPMVCQEPFSTGVGNTLYAMVGSQLTATFRKEAREGTVPGDAVLVEGLPTLPFAVFFLNLIPWDEDPDGTAVQVLKLAISNILTSCEHIGFRSVALPVLSTGIGLRFPNSVVARVLLEEVHAFEQNRAGRTPFLLRVVIPPNDEESSEAFRCVQEAFQIKRFTKDIHQPDQDQLAVLQRSEHVVDGLVFSVRGSREALTPSPSQDLTAPLQLLQGRSSGNAAPRDLGFQEGATGGAPEDGVHVEIIQGTIETQQVDALASPMVCQEPFSTGVGNTLYAMVGSQLTATFRKEAREGTVPGDAVLVEGLTTLPFAVFFLDLIPWDEDPDGTAVQVLKLAISNILTSCEHIGFRSVALPVLSTGIGLRFPNSVVARVLLEEVHAFEQNRAGRTPFLLRVVIPPNDEESSKAFRCVQEAFQIKRFTKDIHQPDQDQLAVLQRSEHVVDGLVFSVRGSREALTPSPSQDLTAPLQLLQGRSSGNAAPRDLGFQEGATGGAPEDGVHVEIIQGTIETQQVDALASPMVCQEPFSTGVGNTLYAMVGSQLTATFRKEAREGTVPGDAVLVEGLPTLPFAVFFLNLIPWDEDPDGTAVQVLKLAISNILTSCEHIGFRSVALPVLSTGIGLRFPNSVVARVLLEEVHAFEQNRAGRTPFLLRVVIPPNDEESSEAFRCVQEAFQIKRFTKDIHQPDQVSTPRTIVLLGKTGSGKSDLANTIFGEQLFKTDHSPNSGTTECQAETKSVNGRSITLIDTPGIFDTKRPEEELKSEIVNCITECAPGPHAFLIVLKVDKFTKQEQAVISEICQCFSEDLLKYAVIVFTHGDQLEEGQTIEKFCSKNEDLRDLVQKCGGRCHVVDNKHWKDNQPDEYRSNQVQLAELLNTIDKMVMENNGGHYTNEVFQVVEEEIRREEEDIKQNMSGNMPRKEIRKQAKTRVSKRLLIQLAGTATGAVLGAFLGLAAMVIVVVKALQTVEGLRKLGGTAVAAAAGGQVAGLAVGGVVLGVSAAAFAAAGGVIGGVIGNKAAREAETPREAVEMAAKAIRNKANAALKWH